MVNDSYFRFDDDNKIKYTFSRSSQENWVSWRPWNLVYRHIVGTFRCAWKWPLWAKFSGRFWPEMVQNRSVYKFLSIFLKIFHWIHTKLDWYARWSYFCRYVKERPRRLKIKVFDYFVKNLHPDSHQSCFICSLGLLSEMCTIWASVQFWRYFEPRSKSKFRTFVTFSKSFQLFHTSIASHTHCKYF